MPAPRGEAMLRRMNSEIFIFLALQAAAVLGCALVLVTVLVLDDGAADAEA